MKTKTHDAIDVELALTEELKLIIVDKDIYNPRMGKGKCTVSGCYCAGYQTSDPGHPGTCKCGHTAADHE